MEATNAQLNRIRRDWSEIAQENMAVEQISGVFYGYGSELACLRLFHKYNQAAHAPNTFTKYSENRKTWFFSLEPRF